MAETWLQRVRQLLSEYNRFAHQFSEALHQTVAQGLPFPDAGWYAESTSSLVSHRAELLGEISGRAWMPESAGWDPPSTDAPLHTVVDSLLDLQQVSSELQRQQDELLPRYTELASAAARLTSRDEAVMPQLEPLRQQARRLQQLFEQQPWVVAERDVQNELESLQSLFHLLADAQRPLPLMPTARREGLTIAELEQHFGMVDGHWGRRMALAALRGLIFSAAFPGCDPRDAGMLKGSETGSELPPAPAPDLAVTPSKPAAAPGSPGQSAPSNTAAGNSTGNSPAAAVAAPVAAPSAFVAPAAVPAVAQPQPVAEKPAPATAAELQNLLQNFGRLRVSTVSAKGVVPVPVPAAAAPAARGTSTAELAALAGCSSALSARAVALWPAITDPQQHVTASTAEHFRALGWGNLALALDLAGELLAERSRSTASFRSELVELLNLTAEAQNAVRVEAEGRELIGEQDQVFQWMRAICHEQSEGVRIDRFMRRDDRANPEANSDVSMRLQTLAKKIRDRIRQGRLLRELEGLVENLKRGAAPGDITGDTRRIPVDWTQIDQTVRELLGTGLHENHCGMRDLLLPVVDLIPEPSGGTADHAAETESDSDSESESESESVEFSEEFNRVLNSISMHLARSTTVVQHEAEVETEDVQYVRERLAGHSIAVVGGVCKPHASARIQKALKLREVRWLSAGKNDRVCQFETDVRGMSLVVLITKLIGHKHNDIREFCRNQGVPWVQTRVQGGYSVNQLARLIREQASEYLDAHSAELAAHAGRERVAC
jgi:HPt (histidine-containing phosphotransfer) domain-containing protein